MNVSASVLEEQLLEAQVESMKRRIFGIEKRSHDDIERDMRRDQYELGKLLRCQAANQEVVVPDSSSSGAAKSSLLYIARLLTATEFSSHHPSSVAYTRCYGLRSLVRVVAGSAPAGAAFSQFPSVENTLRRLGDVTTSFTNAFGAPAPLIIPNVEHAVRAAQDALSAWEDASSGDASQYMWARSLQHKSSSMTHTHTFLPPLPTPCVGLDKYVAFIATMLVSASQVLALPHAARCVVAHGVNRVPQGRPNSVNTDGGIRLCADTDHGTASEWWGPRPDSPPSKHFLLVVNGTIFTIDLQSREGQAYSMPELSNVVSNVFVAAQSSNARNTFNRCSTLSTDNLVDASEDQLEAGKGAYAALRAEIVQLAAHTRQVELLETARFVICVDAGITFKALLQDRQVGSGSNLSQYPTINRWSQNCLNVCIDAEGSIEIDVPKALSLSSASHRQAAPWIEVFAEFLVNRCHSFDDLTSQECEPLRQMYFVQRCVWATGIVFRVVSNTPGKCCLCLTLEQLAQYTHELQRLVPDEEDRLALHVAHRTFSSMISPTSKGSDNLSNALRMMQLYFEECRPFFRCVPHPTVRGPLHVEAVDVEHTRFLTQAIINPLATLQMKSQLSQGDGDKVVAALGMLPLGSFKVVQLDTLEGFSDLSVDEPRFERIDFFSHLPTKEQRLQAIAAAGKVGFHVVHTQQAQAAMEDAAKKTFQRLLYAQESALDRHDPWRRSYRFSFDECVPGVPRPVGNASAPQVSDCVVLNSEDIFKFSRRVSRFLVHDVPRLEDEALHLRCAHPACVVRAVAALAAQLALIHVQLPLRPENVNALLGVTCSIQAWDGAELLVGGDAITMHDALLLYQGYFLPTLCVSKKTAELPRHRAVQLCAHGILRITEHLFEPVQAAHHVRWVGAVQRRGIGNATVPLDVASFSKALPRTPQRRETPWHLHLDALDCLARSAPVGERLAPCVLTLANTPVARSVRAPQLGLAFPPTEDVDVATGDDIRASLHTARARRLHFVDAQRTVTVQGQSSRVLPTRLRMHVLVVKSQRFIDQAILEEVRLDIRGVWGSDAFAAGFIESFHRCFELLWGMWSVDNLDLAGGCPAPS